MDCDQITVLGQKKMFEPFYCKTSYIHLCHKIKIIAFLPPHKILGPFVLVQKYISYWTGDIVAVIQT